jgi:hypothetical protein
MDSESESGSLSGVSVSRSTNTLLGFPDGSLLELNRGYPRRKAEFHASEEELGPYSMTLLEAPGCDGSVGSSVVVLPPPGSYDPASDWISVAAETLNSIVSAIDVELQSTADATRKAELEEVRDFVASGQRDAAGQAQQYTRIRKIEDDIVATYEAKAVFDPRALLSPSYFELLIPVMDRLDASQGGSWGGDIDRAQWAIAQHIHNVEDRDSLLHRLSALAPRLKALKPAFEAVEGESGNEA